MPKERRLVSVHVGKNVRRCSRKEKESSGLFAIEGCSRLQARQGVLVFERRWVGERGLLTEGRWVVSGGQGHEETGLAAGRSTARQVRSPGVVSSREVNSAGEPEEGLA